MDHYRHLFFDLDDTVTTSRSPIDADMYELLSSLPHNIVIISGANSQQIRRQVGDLGIYVLGQNGNEAYNPHGHSLWEELLSEEHSKLVFEHIDALKAHHNTEVVNHDDLIEHRGSQISYSLIGHNMPIEKKRAFDPDRSVRRALLEKVPLDSEHIEAKIGGTTCLDYFMKGRHKGYNVNRLIEHMGWNKDACVYYGDALTPGGNDESVIGVIDTIEVRDHRDTFDKLQELKEIRSELMETIKSESISSSL